jgi:hypothetical protein
LKVAANKERDTAVTDLATSKTSIDALTADIAKLSAGDESNPRIGELEKSLKTLNDKYEAAEKTATDLKSKNDKATLRSDFLKYTNIKDDIAADKVELALSRGDLLFQDGKAGGLVGGEFKTVEEYSAHLDESNSGYLKVVSGGKGGNFSSDGAAAPATTPTAERLKAIKDADGNMPVGYN